MVTVGIGGPSGSGKTLLAREVAGSLPAGQLLSLDSYYRDLADLPPGRRAAVNFDDPAALDWDLLAGHLRRLAAGSPVRVPRYDFAVHARHGSAGTLRPDRDLVVEGLFALHQARVRGFLDLAVFLDAPEEVCLARRIARDIRRRGRTEESVREQWRRCVSPMRRRHVEPTRDRADLVLDGTAPPNRNAAAILSALRQRREVAEARPVHSD